MQTPINSKKKRFKPVYKKILKLRENIKNNKKLLYFKREKWASLILYLKRNAKRYNKYKIKDQHQQLATKYPNRYLSYAKRYRNNLIIFQKNRLFLCGAECIHQKNVIFQFFI